MHFYSGSPMHFLSGVDKRLLASQFGAEYEAYRARTSRLIPGVY
jgi:protein-S-isoprenylcysteine O-methyltransferase Ste14